MYIYISLSITIYLSIYLSQYIYTVIVCDHEITLTSCATCRDNIYIKIYGLFLRTGCYCLKDTEFLVLIRSISER